MQRNVWRYALGLFSVGVFSCGSAPADVAAEGKVNTVEKVSTPASALTVVNNAIGTLPSLHRIRRDKGVQVVTQQHLTLISGDATPYHYHPGPLFAVVAAGVLTEDDGCGVTETHTAGSAFQEIVGHVHRVVNNGTDAVELYITYIIPTGLARSIPATPNCNHDDDEKDD
jgi:quercetin dioxygenase-like cupin family protein